MGIINSYNIIHYGDVLTSCFKLGELSQSPAGMLALAVVVVGRGPVVKY